MPKALSSFIWNIGSSAGCSGVSYRRVSSQGFRVPALFLGQALNHVSYL